MAVTYIAAAAANATSLTLPTHQAGDLLLFVAYGDTAAITAPAGWFTRWTNNIAARGYITVGWKNANSASEVSGTWTNANHVACAVYRSDADVAMSVGGVGTISGANVALITYAAISTTNMVKSDSSSWVVGVVGSRTDDVANTAPSGMTNRVSNAATNEIAIHDSNGGVTSWPTTTVATTSVSYQSAVVEILETSQEFGSGGGGAAFQLVGSGGLVY